MKKLLVLFSTLLLTTGSLFAQSAGAVLERYYKVSGLDQVNLENTTAKIDMKVTANGIVMTMSSILQMPHKMRTEFNAMGQVITMIIDGKQGWLVIPGMPLQTLPEEQIRDAWDQSDLFSSMKWNQADYTLTLGAPEKHADTTFDVVEMVPVKDNSFKKQTLYFDNTTGLLNHAVLIIPAQGNELTVTVYYKKYGKSGDVQYPSLLENRVGTAVSTIEVTEFILNYPVKEEMFSKP